MKVIKNKFIPIGNFSAMNILGFLFIKEDTKITKELIRHEAIHTAQQYEILGVSAYTALFLSGLFWSWWYLLCVVAMPIFIYVLAWLIEVVLPPYSSAYVDSPFEREANQNERDPEYLAMRPAFAWVKYILKDRKNK
jgi:hypothetical protein